MQKIKRFLLTSLFLLCVSPAWSAAPDTITKVKQRSIFKEPYVLLMGLDPTDPTKVIPVLIDGNGTISVVFPVGGAGAVDQGDQAATSGSPWYFTMTRRSDGAEFGLAASPFGVSLFDAASNLLGVAGSPVIVETQAAQTAAEPTVIVVGITPTLIFAASPTTKSVTIQNSGTAIVFLGKAAVTTSTGIGIRGGVVNDDMKGQTAVANHGDDIYGIVSSGTVNVRIQPVSD